MIGISIAIFVLSSFKVFLAGVPLRDLGRLRLCFPIGERLRGRGRPRPRDDLRLADWKAKVCETRSALKTKGKERNVRCKWHGIDN